MDPPGAVPYIDGPHVGALNNSPSADATTSKPENMKKGKQKVKLKRPGANKAKPAREDTKTAAASTKRVANQATYREEADDEAQDRAVLATAAPTSTDKFTQAQGYAGWHAAPVDRERLCNDSMNTGVMAALVRADTARLRFSLVFDAH